MTNSTEDQARTAENEARAAAAAAKLDGETAKLIARQIAQAALHRIKHTADPIARAHMLDHLRMELLRWEEN